MLRVLLFVVVFASAALTVSAVSLDPSVRRHDKGGEVSTQDARRAIAIFRRDPVGPQGEMSQPIILQFAKESPVVEVALDEDHSTWFESKSLSEEQRQVLLVAFVAGDVESQLDSGKTKDDPVAATEQLIATYRQLQKVGRSLKVKEIEELARLQEDGKLAEHFGVK